MAGTQDSWTTDVFDPHQRYNAWDQELGQVFGAWSVDKPRSVKFSASVECQSLDSFKVVECICDPCGARRGHRELVSESSEFLALQLVLEGSERVRFGEELFELAAGDVFVWDSTRNMDFHVLARLHKISVILPLSRLRNWLPASWQSIQRLIRPQTDSGRLLGQYMATLSPRRAAGGFNNCDALIETTLGLLVNSQAGFAYKPVASQRELHLERIRSYIARNLSDPSLSPAQIAKANRISVRYLYWLFKGSGNSVSQYIIQKRLERCRQELASPVTNRRKISDVALSAGFNDVTHFSRRFKQQFGVSPRTFSQEAEGSVSGTENEAAIQLPGGV